jgi:hypothetical protein
MEENLINGFDEIIAHIRKLEDEIKKLREENRLLKEKIK